MWVVINFAVYRSILKFGVFFNLIPTENLNIILDLMIQHLQKENEAAFLEVSP